MSTILVTYELGAGLGHLNRLVAVAQRLQGDHNWVFALPDRALGEPIVRRAFGDKARVLEGVRWPVPNDPNIRKIPTHTFADVIAIIGFNDGGRLSAKTAQWHTILQEVVPNLIIADSLPRFGWPSAANCRLWLWETVTRFLLQVSCCPQLGNGKLAFQP